jgi:hypothetical protein
MIKINKSLGGVSRFRVEYNYSSFQDTAMLPFCYVSLGFLDSCHAVTFDMTLWLE